MNIPNLPFLEKKGKSEYFLSLVIRDEKASAVVFEEINRKINVVGEHVENFKTSVEDATEEEFLEVIDRAVSTAEKSLPPDTESHKTVFGVKGDWIDEGKIKPEYLAKLKKVSDELDFKPMGFLVIPEAIGHLLQMEEGAPLTAILIEIGQKGVNLSLFRTGKIIATKQGSIGESIVSTVEGLLKHFSALGDLPPRIILFDGGREDLQQKFISHKWAKELSFLHLPQISALSSNFDARAVLNGAAQQMGFEVLEASLATAAKEDMSETDALTAAVGEDEDKTLAEVASEFGFSEHDVKTKEEAGEKPKTAVSEALQHENITLSDQFREIPEEVKIRTAERKSLPINAALITTGILRFVKKINIGSLIRGANSSRKKLMLGIIPFILILLFLYVYLFGKTATVTLGIDSRQEEQSENITFSQSAQTNASENTINAEFITVSEDGKKGVSTSGKKEVGDKAKGTVTMFNSNTTGVTIPTGTVITSSNDLKFITDKAVTVASASGDIFSGTDPGKADVTVTAEKFGTNYNFPSDTKFTVEGSTSVAAKNDKPFSGGTKKEVKVVAKKDLDKLASDLQKDLEGKAKEDIKKKAQGNSLVLPNFISVEFDKKSYSKDVDDEASEVSLTAVISFKGVSYKKEDMALFVKDKLSDGEELEVDADSIKVNAANLKEEDGGATAKLEITASLVPKLSHKEIAQKIKGNSVREATAKLSRIDGVIKVDIKLFPPIPFLPERIPFSSGKIKIVTEKNG
ncbi:MAG: baseplate J/gp47 family protein [Candidatus Levybacteria bacterium]|nr:baseplate J/gp47 family protein [Candidatus Levybacteria bacterium]